MCARVPSASIVDYLADREGLRGTARRRFQRFACETLGYGPPAHALRAGFLVWMIPLVALAGFGCEAWSTAFSVAALAWLGFAVLGLGLAFLARRDESKFQQASRETEWLVYCQLLRPMVLAEAPGLLDRNLAAARPDETWEIRPRLPFREFLTRRSSAFWCALTVGWCVGSGLLWVAQSVFSLGFWTLVLPVLGGALGLVAGHFYRQAVYRRVERVAAGLR